MSQERDIIDQIRAGQEEQKSTIKSLADLLSYVGMFVFYTGLFQMLGQDQMTKLNGIVVFVIGILTLAVSWFAPSQFAARHVIGKKYLKNFIFYGKRMVERNMELLDDPLVIARMVEGGDIEHLINEDDEYEAFIRGLGVDWLSDDDVEQKITQAIKLRVKRAEEKESKKWFLSRWGGHITSYWKSRKKDPDNGGK